MAAPNKPSPIKVQKVVLQNSSWTAKNLNTTADSASTKGGPSIRSARRGLKLPKRSFLSSDRPSAPTTTKPAPSNCGQRGTSCSKTRPKPKLKIVLAWKRGATTEASSL